MGQEQELKKVIFLRTESPYPPIGGSRLRDTNLIRVLQEHMEVEVLCFTSSTHSANGHDRSEIPSGVRITAIDRDHAPLWKKAIYPLRPYVVNGYSEAMADALRRRKDENAVLWISRLAMAQYIPLARSLGYRIILDEHDVESLALLGDARISMRTLPNYFLAAQCSYYEGRFCKQSDVVVATSDIDASRLLRIAPGAPVQVIPNSVDCSLYEKLRQEKGGTLFFSGTLSYQPNIDGLRWFMTEVLPRLKAHMGMRIPKIVVAGANPSIELTDEMEEAGIEVHKNPPSILPYLSEAAVVFVPIHTGSGTRLKILEAMAAGRAVVSTGKGAEGLILSPGYDIWIADMADAFTSAILRLIDNPELRAELATHAIQTVENRYDWKCVKTKVKDILTSLAQPQ